MKLHRIGSGAVLVLAVAASASSCGGSGTAGTGGSGAGCPIAPPADGTSCTPPWTSTTSPATSPMAHCSYGDDPRPLCRTQAFCSGGKWQITTPQSYCSTPALPSACLNPPPADTTTCSDATLACWYQDGTRCWCSSCAGGSGYPSCQIINPPQWYCAAPAPGCPTSMPQAGTACSTAGASCGPDCDLLIKCEDGIWKWLKGSCPVCAAPNTPIATPTGNRPIAALRVGDLVYSVDHEAIVAVPLLRVTKTPVRNHRVVRVVLVGGQQLEISPGHPTADGRIFADLHAGSLLDPQHGVVSAELVRYEYDATYDVLPASCTATYFASGALIGSTLSQQP